jgi:hypothetical protein
VPHRRRRARRSTAEGASSSSCAPQLRELRHLLGQRRDLGILLDQPGIALRHLAGTPGQLGVSLGQRRLEQREPRLEILLVIRLVANRHP